MSTPSLDPADSCTVCGGLDTAPRHRVWNVTSTFTNVTLPDGSTRSAQIAGDDVRCIDCCTCVVCSAQRTKNGGSVNAAVAANGEYVALTQQEHSAALLAAGGLNHPLEPGTLSPEAIAYHQSVVNGTTPTEA